MAALQVDYVFSMAVQRAAQSANIAYDLVSLLDEAADEAAQQFIEVVNGAVDQVISLGSLTTVEGLLLTSDEPLTIKVNGAAVGFQVKNFAVQGAAITSLSVSNSSGVSASARVVMAGT